MSYYLCVFILFGKLRVIYEVYCNDFVMLMIICVVFGWVVFFGILNCVWGVNYGLGLNYWWVVCDVKWGYCIVCYGCNKLIFGYLGCFGDYEKRW